ncbi:MAG: sigma-70 family RNA polymerase sigma factor [Verrucomicrobiota bacterium]
MKSSAIAPAIPPRPAGEGSRDWKLAADADLARMAAMPDRAGREAFVEIVRRHQTAVCAVAWSVTGRVGLTDDIAQEAFFKAWRQIASLRDPAKLKAWLTRIAHGCAVDALRREKSHVPLDDPASGPGLEAAASCCSAASPDKAVADAEEEALVWSALARLPENLRTPLVLFYREDQSMPAVAAALDLSEEAVRQRLSRGRQALKSAVETRIETVLGRVQPSALLVVTIAAGIGLLPGPAAVAAGVSSGALAAGSVGSAGGGVAAAASATTATGAAVTATGFSTFMTATSWLAAAISLAAFLPLGWRVSGTTGLSGAGATAALPASPAAGDPFAAYANSQLLAAWRQLHADHGSDAAAMPVIYVLITGEPDPFRRRALGIALMSEWSAVDPEGAFQFLWSEKNNRKDAGWMMREWLKRDPDKAAAHLLSRLSSSEDLAADVAKDVAEFAPAHFMALLTALPPPASGDNLPPPLAQALYYFASRDLQAVIDALTQLKGAVLSSARTSIGPLLARTDPAAGLKWSRSLDSEDERMAAGNGVMATWAKTDPAAALASLDASHESRRLAQTVLSAAASQDLPGALRLWRENPAKFDKDTYETFRPALNLEFGKNPAATLKLLNAQPQEIRSSLVKQLNCADLSPAATATLWDWARQQQGAGAAGELGGNLLVAAFQNKDPDVLARLKSLPEESQAAACARAGDFLGDLEPGQFEKLLGSVSPAARIPLIAAGIGPAGREAEPDLLLWRQRLDELPPETQARSAGGFAGYLVEKDPRLAVSFADSLPEGPVKDAAYGEVMGNWAVLDTYQASMWADQLPPGSARDAASAVLVRRLFDKDVDAALTWAAAIGNAELRLKCLTEFVKRDYQPEPGAVQAFLSNPLLSPADREALLRLSTKPNPAN